MTDANYERSLEEARMDLDYCICANGLHFNYYSRIRWLIAFIQLFLATAAAAPLVGVDGPPWLVTCSGALLATITIVDVLSDFAGRQNGYRGQWKKYQALKAEAAGEKDLARFEGRRQKIAIDDLGTLRALEISAYNRVVTRHDRLRYVLPATWFQRLVAWFA